MQQDVLGDGQIVDETQFLGTNGNARAKRVGRVGWPVGLAVEKQRSGVRIFETDNDLSQRRFAGPVLANQSVDAAGRNLQVDIPQHGSGKRLADSLGDNPQGWEGQRSVTA